MPHPRIKRALISVYDKTGVVDFARALVTEFGIEIISTGGTAKLLKESGIPVTLVEEITGFPEMLDGRVKTLHPKIHAAILADRDNPEHMRQLAEQGIKPIDMVVVNLYPFEKTIADPNCTFEQAIEMIDIGGPCMLRAAAKNHKHVIPIAFQRSYDYVRGELRESGDVIESGRAVLASTAFEATSAYDSTIEAYLTHIWTEMRCGPDSETTGPKAQPVEFPESLVLILRSKITCRYGENPHQTGAYYAPQNDDDSDALVCTVGAPSSDLSFNNLVDAGAAFDLCRELTLGCGTLGCGTLGCGTGVSPVGRVRWSGVEGDQQSERNLPHLQTTGRSYFVTFRTKDRTLPPDARNVVLDAIKYWDARKLSLHAAVVMPDHVHILLTPFELETGASIDLGEIVHSIKSYSAHKVNEQQGWSGPLWQDERWDRIMRNRKEFAETFEYIETNPDRSGLGKSYPWFWRGQGGFEDGGLVQREAHRRDAGATPPGHHVCVFVKHTNACGVGIAAECHEAYHRAYLGDPNAAMGGVLACNFEINLETAAMVMDTYDRWGKELGVGGFFVEVWLAPSFRGDDVVAFIHSRKTWGPRIRLLDTGNRGFENASEYPDCKRVTGGMLVQTRDHVSLNEDQWKVVTKHTPSGSEMFDLRLAWLIAKHTKSNAISICKDGMLIGNGAGQMSRVMSCRIATWLAKENGHENELKGSVAASDAFFPFADGPNLLIDAGVTAIIQPGGSKRDQEVIDACNARDVAMIFTGTRHFKH